MGPSCTPQNCQRVNDELLSRRAQLRAWTSIRSAPTKPAFWLPGESPGIFKVGVQEKLSLGCPGDESSIRWRIATQGCGGNELHSPKLPRDPPWAAVMVRVVSPLCSASPEWPDWPRTVRRSGICPSHRSGPTAKTMGSPCVGNQALCGAGRIVAGQKTRMGPLSDEK